MDNGKSIDTTSKTNSSLSSENAAVISAMKKDIEELSKRCCYEFNAPTAQHAQLEYEVVFSHKHSNIDDSSEIKSGTTISRRLLDADGTPTMTIEQTFTKEDVDALTEIAAYIEDEVRKCGLDFSDATSTEKIKDIVKQKYPNIYFACMADCGNTVRFMVNVEGQELPVAIDIDLTQTEGNDESSWELGCCDPNGIFYAIDCKPIKRCLVDIEVTPKGGDNDES